MLPSHVLRPTAQYMTPKHQCMTYQLPVDTAHWFGDTRQWPKKGRTKIDWFGNIIVMWLSGGPSVRIAVRGHNLSALYLTVVAPNCPFDRTVDRTPPPVNVVMILQLAFQSN